MYKRPEKKKKLRILIFLNFSLSSKEEELSALDHDNLKPYEQERVFSPRCVWGLGEEGGGHHQYSSKKRGWASKVQKQVSSVNKQDRIFHLPTPFFEEVFRQEHVLPKINASVAKNVRILAKV